ncbi:hypothetical protein [uncultured Bilophila sp.]|uniref:hypothetical protein n=1 Tax=uncultured Bilophila sp. TaxID=529385 RepID=UPI00266EAB3F|nr:hypothetical protein [uncultured Bilophila sp.]
MSQGIGEVGGSGNVSSVGSLGPITSINFIFAKLQMELAATSKEAARDHISQVEKANADQKEVADLLNKLRNLQENAANEKGTSNMGTFKNCQAKDDSSKGTAAEELAKVEGYIADAKKLQAQANLKTKENYDVSKEYDSTMMPDVMEQYFKDNDIDYADYGVSARQNGSEWQRAINSLEDRKAALEVFAYMDTHGLAYSTGSSKDDLDVAIQSLQAHQDTLGTDVQTEMVYVQDFMGQYNSFTQGANSAIQSAMQTLTNVARGQ